MDRSEPPRTFVNAAEIHPFPQKQSRLSESQVRRIRLLRAALWSVYPHSMNHWLEGFERDAAPEPEICWWEHVAAAYLEFEQIMAPEEGARGMLFWVMTQIFSGSQPDDIDVLRSLPDSAKIVETMRSILKSSLPIQDIRETP